MLHDLIKPGILFMEFVHAELIPYPEVDEQGTGKPGRKPDQVDEEVALGAEEISVDEKEGMLDHS